VDDLPALVADPGYVGFTLPTNISSNDFVQPLTYERYTSSTPSMALTCLVLMGHLTTAQTTTQIRRNIIRRSTQRLWIVTSSLSFTYLIFFANQIAPYLTLLLNGVGWNVGFPRLLTTSQLALAKRLAAVGDISCDIGGGLEFVSRATTLDSPSYDVNGVTVVAVDILPASLPRDASIHFSEKLLRYVRSAVNAYKGIKGEDVEASDALKRATIGSEGRLQPGHEWLAEKVEAWRAAQAERTESKRPASANDDRMRLERVGERKKRVLVLGSGMVAGPAVDELASRSDVKLIVGECHTQPFLGNAGVMNTGF